jgi:excisionase family DNA binding protein
MEYGKFMAPKQVADYLKVNVRTVLRWLHAGKLVHMRIGRKFMIETAYVKNLKKLEK